MACLDDVTVNDRIIHVNMVRMIYGCMIGFASVGAGGYRPRTGSI